MPEPSIETAIVSREHEWAVILAGGDGNRLKSLTRKIAGDERPKQFCSVMSGATLLEESQRRATLELARERTLYLVNRAHEKFYAPILASEPASNIVAQPRNRGTALAILYSLLRIAAVDSDALAAFLPSDHYISDNGKFMAHVRAALDAARRRPDLVILLGVEPENPEVEYGWIEPMDQIAHNQPEFATGAEQSAIERLYEHFDEINFSQQVLALHPQRLAVLRVSGVRWNDLGGHPPPLGRCGHAAVGVDPLSYSVT